jgi:hypothetical protein
MVLYVVAFIRQRKRLDTIMRDLQEERKGKGVAFDQPKDSYFKYDLDQPATQPSWMSSDIGPLNRRGKIFKDPTMVLSRLFPDDCLEEMSKESFGILSEALCHSLVEVSVLVSSYCSPFLPTCVDLITSLPGSVICFVSH